MNEERKEGRKEGRMEGRKEGRKDGWKDGWMIEGIDEQLNNTLFPETNQMQP